MGGGVLHTNGGGVLHTNGGIVLDIILVGTSINQFYSSNVPSTTAHSIKSYRLGENFRNWLRNTHKSLNTTEMTMKRRNVTSKKQQERWNSYNNRVTIVHFTTDYAVAAKKNIEKHENNEKLIQMNFWWFLSLWFSKQEIFKLQLLE